MRLRFLYYRFGGCDVEQFGSRKISDFYAYIRLWLFWPQGLVVRGLSGKFRITQVRYNYWFWLVPDWLLFYTC